MIAQLESADGLIYATVVIEIVLIFVSRYSYNILSSNQTGGDAFGNFLQVRDIRRNGHRVPENPGQSVMSGRYAYPYFFLWLLSYIPERHLPKVDRVFNPLMDVTMGAILLLLVPLGILSELGAAVALGVLLFTPQFMRPDLPQGKGFTQRKPGLLLTTASVLSFLVWFNGGPNIALPASFFLGGLVCLTSKFSLQAMTFIYLGFGLLLTPISLLIPPGSVILAIVVSIGKYYRILTGHLRHVYDYAKARQYQRFDHSLPNPITYLGSLLTISSPEELLEFVYSTKFTRALLDNPFIIAVGTAYIAILIRREWLVSFAGINAWIAVGIVCFVTISMPHLLFLGESERYLEYIFVPSAALIGIAATAIPSYPLVLVPVFGVGIVVQVVYMWGYVNVFQNPERGDRVSELVEFLKDKDGDVVAVQPAYKSREIAWRTDKKVLEDIGGHTTSTEEARKEKNMLFDQAEDNYLTEDADWIGKRYSPDWIVFDTEKIREISNKEGYVPGIEPPQKSPKYENNRFEVYEFKALLRDNGR
jgi:hypothetical protein